MDHDVALFRFLYHVGLVAAADVDCTWQQAARLSVHLDRYRLVCLKPRVSTLRQPDPAMSADLKPSLCKPPLDIYQQQIKTITSLEGIAKPAAAFSTVRNVLYTTLVLH